jgi:hypothetical protein
VLNVGNKVDVLYNILITNATTDGRGVLAFAGTNTSDTMNIFNNTVLNHSNSSGAYNGIYGEENSTSNQPKYIRNNLVINTVATTGGAISTNGPAYNSTIVTSSDYNAFSATINPVYKDITVQGGLTHDILNAVPAFVDSTRGLASWGATKGYASADATIDALVKINGYNSTTKTQSDTPPAGVTPAALFTWAWPGFAPTSAALHNTGYGGVDIGAVDVLIQPVTVLRNSSSFLNLGLGL